MRTLLLALALTAAAPVAFPQTPVSREQALAALESPDAARRAVGIVWLANRGTAADDSLLHERLRDESAFVRSYAEQGLWLLWSRSGDAATDAAMAQGTEEMRAGRHAEAIATFSEIIGRKPAFAEAWNKRATVHYLAGNYRESLADCDEVLKRNPRHFGALSGAGMVSLALEQYTEAERWFRRALEVNPNMVGVELELLKLEERRKAKRGNSA